VEANLNRIERDISRLDSLVGTVSHLVANTAIQPAESESLDLAELVGEVVEICGPEAASKGIELRPTFSPAPMKGDRTLLVSTAENLIGNALRYAPAGSHIEITVTNHPPRITVSDQGPGVPSGELNRIFDAFFRSSAARERQTGGVGLGLSIVRRAASAHGGQAWAENREGGGLAVSATFGS
jgi:signal transduction histidine kinase